MARIRRSAALAAALLALLAPATVRTQEARRAPAVAGPRPPRLIVLVAVDQMRPDYFTRFAADLTGGLHRLYAGGAVFTNAYHDHAITETAPGHSVMLSGRFPRSTGIALNDEGVLDPQAPMLHAADSSASPYRFRGSVLIDWLRTAEPDSRALSVSRKDRGAILPIGRAKQNVYWYAPTYGFTTSRYYGDTLPSWVNAFNARNPIARFAGHRWDLLLPSESYGEADSVPLEHGGRDFTFPHLLPDASNLRRLGFELKEDPVMDSLTLALALDGVHALALGAGPHTDLLSVSLSTTDAVGHRYGPDSRELHDQIVRLDRLLGAFLDSLDAQLGADAIAVALTADHGMTPYSGVPSAHDDVRNGRRINDSALVTDVRRDLAARGVSVEAVRFDFGMLRVDRAALRAAGIAPDSLVRAIAARLRATPGIARVDDFASLAARDTVRDSLARLWLHHVPSGEPVVLVASLTAGSEWARSGTVQHGSPSALDRHVPLIFYGPWFRAGRHDARVRVVDLAPTLAAAAGVMPTERLDGHVLTAALRAPKPASAARVH